MLAKIVKLNESETFVFSFFLQVDLDKWIFFL